MIVSFIVYMCIIIFQDTKQYILPKQNKIGINTTQVLQTLTPDQSQN